jgi:hypothetical protein
MRGTLNAQRVLVLVVIPGVSRPHTPRRDQHVLSTHREKIAR